MRNPLKKFFRREPSVMTGSSVSLSHPKEWIQRQLENYETLEKGLALELNCAKPFHDPYMLLAYLRSNGYHSAAIFLKVAAVVCQGWEASPALTAAIERANRDQTFEDFLMTFAFDFEVFGYNFTECITNAGQAAFYRMPSAKTRVRLPEKPGDGVMYCNYEYTSPDINQFHQLALHGTLHAPYYRGMDRGVRMMKHLSMEGDRYYGDPEYSSVTDLLSLHVSIIAYAKKFFSQSMMADMAIITKGTQISDVNKEKIKNYITNHFKGVENAHKLLFLDVERDEDIRFEKLQPEMLNDGFGALRADNRDEIAAGNRVSPRLVSILQAGSLGGVGEVEGQLKIFKMFFVDGRQRLFERFFQTLFEDMGLPDPKSFRFKPLDVTAGITDMQTLVQGVEAGILSQLEARSEWNTEKSAHPSKVIEWMKKIREELARG